MLEILSYLKPIFLVLLVQSEALVIPSSYLPLDAWHHEIAGQMQWLMQLAVCPLTGQNQSRSLLL